jgi:hypothetical protein
VVLAFSRSKAVTKGLMSLTIKTHPHRLNKSYLILTVSIGSVQSMKSADHLSSSAQG